MSDGGAEPGGSPVLLAEPAATGRAREKLPTRAELESALRAGGGSGGAAGGFKDIPGTSAVSPGSSKQCAPDTESPSGTGEADYCRRILVRDAKGTIREIVLPKGLDLDRPKRTRTSFTAEQLYRLELEFQRCQSRCGSRTAARSRRRTRAGTLRNAPPAPPPNPSPPATSCGCWSKAACSPPCRPLRASCPPPIPAPAPQGTPELWPRRDPHPRGWAAAGAPRYRRLSACTSRLWPLLPRRRLRRLRRRRGCRGGRCVLGGRCWAACTMCPELRPSSLTRGWRGRTVLCPARSRALKNLPTPVGMGGFVLNRRGDLRLRLSRGFVLREILPRIFPWEGSASRVKFLKVQKNRAHNTATPLKNKTKQNSVKKCHLPLPWATPTVTSSPPREFPLGLCHPWPAEPWMSPRLSW